MFKVKQKGNKYVTFSSSHLKDPSLSLEAKGLQSWFLMKYPTWSGTFNDILDYHYGLTQSSLIKILNELKQNGYIEQKGDEYIVNEDSKEKKNKEFVPIELTDSANNDVPKKQNLYEKCWNFIDEFTEDSHLRKALKDYLKLRFNPGVDSRLATVRIQYFNQWRNLLLTLNTMEGNKVKIVEQSYSRQWAKFVDIANTRVLDNVKSGSYSEKEMNEFRERLNKAKKGEQVEIDFSNDDLPF